MDKNKLETHNSVSSTWSTWTFRKSEYKNLYQPVLRKVI